MPNVRHLSNAPITEAIIDFRVDLREGAKAESIVANLQLEDIDYRKVSHIVRGSFGFELRAGETPAAEVLPSTASVIGVRLHSNDEKYVAQLSTEGFSLSRLEPYETWEKLVEEAKRVWSHYAERVEPSVITRVATRFINNLRLPLQSGGSFGRFLTQQPNYPADLPQAMSGFLQRYVLHDSNIGATIIVTQALEGLPRDGDALPVILDLDAFKALRFQPNSPEMWTCLGQLRELKNKFFFASITEEAVEIYQ